MPRAQPRPTTPSNVVSRKREIANVRVAQDGDLATSVGAVDLQRQLQLELEADGQPRRLPLAISLPLIAGVSAGLWGGIALGLRLLLKA